MRAELEEIEYIEKYLQGELSAEQINQFETRLKTDKEFADKVKAQKLLMKRVNRLSIKHSVAQAHRKHTSRNILMFKRNKNFFRTFISFILVLVIAYLIYNSEAEKERSNTVDTTEVKQTDSIFGKKDTLN